MSLNNDEQLEWFAGDTSKKDCEALVVSALHGSYLIRKDSKSDRYILCVNDRGTVVTFPIVITQGNKCLVGDRLFNTLHDLVASLRSSAIKGRNGVPLRLKTPAPGGTAFSSEDF
jgi:hypothetical protein